MPKPNADLCMRVDLPLDKKTVENQDWTGLGHRAAGPPGRGAVASRGPRAAGPGLLLAKPANTVIFELVPSK